MRSHVRTGGVCAHGSTSTHPDGYRRIAESRGKRAPAPAGSFSPMCSSPSWSAVAPPRTPNHPARPGRHLVVCALLVLPVLLTGRRGRLVRSGQDRFCRPVLRPREEADSRAPGRRASERERIFALQTTVDVGGAASGPAAVDCGSDSGEPRGVEGACGNRRVRSRAEREPEGVPQVRQELDEVGLIAGMDV